MAKKLFIGKLPYALTSEELKELFAQAGTVVSANVIIDRMTNQSKGFGFVEYETDEEAEKAIQMFNNYEINGKQIVVNEARPKEDNANRPFNRNNSGLRR